MIMTHGSPVLLGPLVTAVANRSLFCFTARPQYSGLAGNDHNRETSDTFSRGYAENVTLNFNSSAEWVWRRIVFAFVGDVYVGQGSTADTPFADFGGSGMTRYWNTITPPAQGTLTQNLYEGAFNIDWTDEIVAKIDTKRIKLFRDTTRYLRPRVNAQGHEHRFKFWYPINQRLCYNDPETGKTDILNYVSTSGHIGIGDCYIYDIIVPVTGTGGLTNNVSITANGRYYWHER